MPKSAFIIIAHKNPGQLSRLIDRLSHANSVIYVHIDSKIEIAPFQDALENQEIHWLKRERSQWGSIGMVNAMMNGLLEVSKNPEIDRATLISGLDYPIKSIDQILNFFKENSNKNFFNLVKFSESGWPEDKKKRITKHYFFIKDKLFEYPKNPKNNSLFRDFLNMVLGIFLTKERSFPTGIEPWGGDVWFSFTREMINQILTFHQERPDLYRFNKRCLCSDEVFLHTVVGNVDPGLETIEPTVTYTDWEDRNNPHPRTLDVSDLEKLKNSEALFARKFDEQANKEVLDKIDKQLLGQEV